MEEELERYNADNFTKILITQLFQRKMMELNLKERLLVSQAIQDFQDYMSVKHGKHWRAVFRRMFDQHPLTLSTQLDNWIWLWLQKWLQRVKLVTKKPKHPPHKSKPIHLNVDERQALINYAKEVLVRRGEIVGISQIAEATVTVAQRRLGKRERGIRSRTALMLKLTHEIHWVLQSLLYPTNKVLLITFDSAMEEAKKVLQGRRKTTQVSKKRDEIQH